MKLLHRYFIPGEHNEYRPHYFRQNAFFVLTLLVFLLELAFFVDVFVVGIRSEYFALILSNVIVDMTNTNRLEHDVAGLQVNPLLEKAARRKAEDMVQKGYFAHTSPDGETPWDWLADAGYEFASAGENLAINFVDSGEVIDAWMNSPGHRANILNNRFTEIGVAAVHGTYNGKPTIFVVQYFGNPREQARKPATIIASAQAAEVIPDDRIDDNALALNLGEEAVQSGAIVFEPPIITEQAPFLARAVAAPRSTLATFYYFLILLHGVALALTVFYELRIHHPHPILSGAGLVVLIVGAILINVYAVGNGAVL